MLKYFWKVFEYVFRTFLRVQKPIDNIERCYEHVIFSIGLMGQDFQSVQTIDSTRRRFWVATERMLFINVHKHPAHAKHEGILDGNFFWGVLEDILKYLLGVFGRYLEVLFGDL